MELNITAAILEAKILLDNFPEGVANFDSNGLCI
jgi:hypothetical protein